MRVGLTDRGYSRLSSRCAKDMNRKRHSHLLTRVSPETVRQFLAHINPSKPENQQWLRDGAEWLFDSLPDIGGINLENGDFMSCYCDECRAQRAMPANDPNCF